jgi:hypothetical protein
MRIPQEPVAVAPGAVRQLSTGAPHPQFMGIFAAVFG